jgi:hypothetical protein
VNNYLKKETLRLLHIIHQASGGCQQSEMYPGTELCSPATNMFSFCPGTQISQIVFSTGQAKQQTPQQLLHILMGQPSSSQLSLFLSEVFIISHFPFMEQAISLVAGQTVTR